MTEIRLAREADGAALAEIYRPAVSERATSFEVDPPDAAEMAQRVTSLVATHPWLVCVEDGQHARLRIRQQAPRTRRVPVVRRGLCLRPSGSPSPRGRHGTLRVALRRAEPARLPQCICRDHAAERRQRRLPRVRRLCPRRDVSPDRLEAWRLARRALAAAGPRAARRGPSASGRAVTLRGSRGPRSSTRRRPRPHPQRFLSRGASAVLACAPVILYSPAEGSWPASRRRGQ